jgi:hypothetical protein
MNDKPPTPKRGAFPTPKQVLEKAPRYVPEPSNSPDDGRRKETDSPPDRPPSDDSGDEAKEPKPK